MAVVHRGIRLAPRLRGLAHLECRFVGEPDGPARAEVDEVFVSDGIDGRRTVTACSQSAMARDRSCPRPARSSANAVVGKRVCTTLDSSAKCKVTSCSTSVDKRSASHGGQHDLGRRRRERVPRRRSRWWCPIGSSPARCRSDGRRGLPRRTPSRFRRSRACREGRRRPSRRTPRCRNRLPASADRERSRRPEPGLPATRRQSAGWDWISSSVTVMPHSMRTHAR